MSLSKVIILIERLTRATNQSEKRTILQTAVKELRSAGLNDSEIVNMFRYASIGNRNHGEPIIKSETIDSWKRNEDDYNALLREVLKESE